MLFESCGTAGCRAVNAACCREQTRCCDQCTGWLYRTAADGCVSGSFASKTRCKFTCVQVRECEILQDWKSGYTLKPLLNSNPTFKPSLNPPQTGLWSCQPKCPHVACRISILVLDILQVQKYNTHHSIPHTQSRKEESNEGNPHRHRETIHVKSLKLDLNP